MQRLTICLAVCAAAWLGAAWAGSADPPPRGDGVLSVLIPGQTVAVKDVGGRYEIGLLSNMPQVQAYRVHKVGADFVVLRDLVEVNELRVPITSIKVVTVLNLPRP